VSTNQITLHKQVSFWHVYASTKGLEWNPHP